MSKEILLNKLEKQFGYYELVDERQETINYSKIVDFLEDKKDQQISDLEAKLAESEEKINMLEEHKFYADNIVSAYADKCKKYEQQLTEKDKLIDFYINSGKEQCEEINKLNHRTLNYCDAIDQANQDKISFAVEKLKKLKDRLSSMQWCFTGRRNFLQEVEFMRKSQEEMVDEEIEDLLKEMK